jgi:hypothetical protein
MQKRVIINILLFSLSVITLAYIKIIPNNYSVFAITPAFPHKIIIDAPHDWGVLPLDDISNCDYVQKHKNIITYPDLESISYFSDGRTQYYPLVIRPY